MVKISLGLAEFTNSTHRSLKMVVRCTWGRTWPGPDEVPTLAGSLGVVRHPAAHVLRSRKQRCSKVASKFYTKVKHKNLFMFISQEELKRFLYHISHILSFTIFIAEKIFRWTLMTQSALKISNIDTHASLFLTKIIKGKWIYLPSFLFQWIFQAKSIRSRHNLRAMIVNLEMTLNVYQLSKPVQQSPS
jgi:hypothetical protein